MSGSGRSEEPGLRHAFASLLIHEGRLSVVDIAARLGHNPTVCFDTYAHVIAEQRGAEPVSAERETPSAASRSSASWTHAIGTGWPVGLVRWPPAPHLPQAQGSCWVDQ